MYRFAYLVNFLMTASAGIVFIFLADLQERFGLSGVQTGAVAAASFVASLSVALFLAPLADRGGLRTVAGIAIAFGITGNLLFIAANGFLMLIAARILVGVGIGLFLASARKALIGIDTDGSGEVMGTLLSSGVAGFLIGPVLGASLEGVSFAAPFWVVVALISLAAIPALRWIQGAPVVTATVDVRDMLPLLGRPAIQGALCGNVFLFANIGIFDSISDIYLTDLGASSTLTALLILTIGLPLVVFSPIAGRFVDRSDPRRTLILVLVLAIPTISLFGAGSLVLFGVAGIIQGTLEATAFPSAQVVVVNETGAHEAALGQGLLDAAGQATAAVTAVAGPAIYEAFGAGAAFGGLAGLGAALTATAAWRLRSPR